MSRKKKSEGVISFISYVFLIMLFVGIVGFLSVFTDGFKTSLKTSGIEYNGQALSKTDSTLTLECNKDLEFNVNFLGEDKEYTVEIVPCNSFSYTVNDTFVSFENIITEFPKSLYSVNKTSKGFTLNMKDFNIMTILKDFHGEKSKIVLSENCKLFGSYYALVISIEGEEDNYEIPFDLVSAVEGVEIGGNIVL